MIANLEGEITGLAQKLCDKILAQGSDPFDTTVAYSNLTTDAISGYCFGEGFGLLEQDGVGSLFLLLRKRRAQHLLLK